MATKEKKRKKEPTLLPPLTRRETEKSSTKLGDFSFFPKLASRKKNITHQIHPKAFSHGMVALSHYQSVHKFNKVELFVESLFSGSSNSPKFRRRVSIPADTPPGKPTTSCSSFSAQSRLWQCKLLSYSPSHCTHLTRTRSGSNQPVREPSPES
jgi:hypothetical protein